MKKNFRISIIMINLFISLFCFFSVGYGMDLSLRDGDYYGEAEDYGGDSLKVKVTVKRNKIHDIEIVESKEDGYVFMVSGLIPLIIELQSLEVDAVTGATISSKAFISAIKNALS